MTLHKKFACSIVGLACALVMWQAMKNSCPPREQHLQAVTDVVERTVDRIFEEKINFPEESRQIAEYLAAEIIPKAVERLTAERIDFTDYGIFSLGNIEDENGEAVPISIGLFGKVFTISEEQAEEYIDSLLSDSEIDYIINNLKEKENGNEDVK